MAEPPRNKVLNSVENPFGDFCVDIFVRPDGIMRNRLFPGSRTVHDSRMRIAIVTVAALDQ
jgi:hypothetical protein